MGIWTFGRLLSVYIPPSQGLKAIQIPHSMSFSGDQIPTPKILIQWP